jgi:hypothetical protein
MLSATPPSLTLGVSGVSWRRMPRLLRMIRQGHQLPDVAHYALRL